MDGSAVGPKLPVPRRHLQPMPSLVRFLIVVGVIVALVYGAMLALVAFVEPVPRPMEQAIPASKLNPPKTGTAAP